MVYQRVLRLPCDNIRSGIGFKATLDAALKQLLEGMFKGSDGFKIEFGDHTGGHLRALISRGVQKFEVECCYGQNSAFEQGKKVSFVSYTVRALGVLGAADRSANGNENGEVIGRIAGVVVAVALSCALMSSLLQKSGKFILLLPVFAAVVWGGKWLGARIGRMAANAVQGGGMGSAASSADAGQANVAWKRLTHAIESVTSGYPTA